MPPPRYPRHRSTPAPTIEPPLTADDDAPPVERIVKRLEPWKALVAVAIALVGTGVAFATWQASVARTGDVDQVRAGVAVELARLQAEQQALSVRTAKVESIIVPLAKHVDLLLEQAIEIAKATGARQVVEPAQPMTTTQGAAP